VGILILKREVAAATVQADSLGLGDLSQMRKFCEGDYVSGDVALRISRMPFLLSRGVRLSSSLWRRI
jgi:hypothetical protein